MTGQAVEQVLKISWAQDLRINGLLVYCHAGGDLTEDKVLIKYQKFDLT